MNVSTIPTEHLRAQVKLCKGAETVSLGSQIKVHHELNGRQNQYYKTMGVKETDWLQSVVM